MYAEIISDNTVRFEVNSIGSDNISTQYTDISNILSENMRAVINKEFSKQILNGRSLQLIPYTIAKEKAFTSHNKNTNRVYYQKSYTLDIKEECVTTESTQDIAIMSDQQSTSIRHNTTHDQSTEYNKMQSNNISSDDDSCLLGMISNTSVVTTESTQDIAINV